MPRNYNNKKLVNIKMTSMYNKLCNKQAGLFSTSMSYLHKGEGSPIEFNKNYTSFDLIKLCLFHGNIFIFYPFL
jgi:hypothetical protein